MKRREFLTLSSITALYIFTGCGGESCGGENSNNNLPFQGDTKKGSLPIPTLLEPTIQGGVKHFDLDIKEAKHEFFDNIKTDTYAISSTYLGPTIKVEDGDEVSINFTNNLSEPTTMHGHGMHVPPSMDGGPHQVIEANKSWSARYRVKQKACTNWYHPHLMGKTADHVYKGLAGLIIIEDDESKALDLPKRYGIDDIPLVLQDRKFDSSGQIDYSPSMMEVMRGYVGDTFITNGAIEPIFESEAKEIRFRVLNGSNSTVYKLGFNDSRTFKQIATDNSFLEAPVSLKRLVLSPGERAEIVVDFSNDFGSNITLFEYRYNKTFLKIEINKQATTTTTLPNTLTTLEKFDPSDALRTRSFTLSGMMGSFKINGKSMDLNRIDEYLKLDEIEIWEVTNNMMVDHNFHIHATHFMVIERNGSASKVAKSEKGYKDVVYLPPNASVKFIVKMRDYIDANVPYMYHCHFLEHEDRGMMGQFIVS